MQKNPNLLKQLDLKEKTKYDFVGLINTLSDSIKEYYKVTKNVNKNENILINSCINEINNSELIINKIIEEGISNNNTNLFINIINKLGEALKKLQTNIISNDKNLIFFVEDAKIIFTKMKEQQHILLNFKNKDKSVSSHISEKELPINSNSNNNNSDIMKIYATAPSEMIIRNNDINNNNINLDGKNLKRARSLGKNQEENKEVVINNEKSEIERLKKKVKQYEGYIKKVNTELQKYKLQNNLSVSSIKENKSKDKIILSLKENLNINNIKFNKLINNLNNCKNIIKQLKDENHKLKMGGTLLNNNYNSTKSETNKNLGKKMNNLLEDKSFSDNNYKIANLEESNIIKDNKYEKEIELFKQKISSIEKQLLLEKKKNQELINENILLKKNESDISIITKNNNELNSNDNNKGFEDLKKENDDFLEKIKYYKTQIKKIKNELYEKIQTNIELEINYDKKINDMKNDCDKKIEEIINKNKNLEINLEECQKLNNELIQQINDLNKQIIVKDIKVLELNYKIEKAEKNVNNKDNNNNNENNELEINKNLEDQNLINKDLIDDNKDNKNLNIENRDNKEILNLNNEIEELKKENLILKNNNDKLNNKINDIINKAKLTDNNPEIVKTQSEELEGLKQKIIKFQNDKIKGDDKIKTLKKENEKIKAQLLRLSKSLPEEYNDLLKEYNNLEIKFKNNLKNNKNYREIGTQTNSINSEQINELNKAKKEIEIIKKKNMELVKQLEEKEIKKNCYDNKSEQNVSNFEEEFDLRKMAKGAKDKNRSQDINIDYPGIQDIKEKYRELNFYYNSLQTLVKKLLLNIYCNPKNKAYINELCKMVGFDLDTTNRILNNKNKNFILGLFNK